ncbi:MAG: cupin domain-containing protein [Pseudomonadota bacterium]
MPISISAEMIAPIELFEGRMKRKRVLTGQSSLTLTSIEPGVELALHSHEWAQIGYVLEGEGEFTVGEEGTQRKVWVGPGDFFSSRRVCHMA